MLRGAQDAFAAAIPPGYFAALCDTPEEADALHRLHVHRCESAKAGQRAPDYGAG